MDQTNCLIQGGMEILKSNTASPTKRSKRGKKSPQHPVFLGCTNDLVWLKEQTSAGRWEGPRWPEQLCLGPGHLEAEPLAEVTWSLPGLCVPCSVVMTEGRSSKEHVEYTGPAWVLGDENRKGRLSTGVSVKLTVPLPHGA